MAGSQFKESMLATGSESRLPGKGSTDTYDMPASESTPLLDEVAA